MSFERAQRLKQLPPYLFADLRKKINAARAEGKDIISLGIGDPDQPTPDPIIDEMVRAIRDVADPDRHRYGCDVPVDALRDEIAAFYQRYFGVSLKRENVCVTMGSKDAIAQFPMAWMNPGDLAIAPNPGYPTYNIGHVFAGGSTYFMPLKAENGFLPVLEEIPADVARKAKMLWVNYPNNPTTATADVAFYDRLIAYGKKHDLIIASDQAYALNTYDGYRSPSLLAAKDAMDCGVEFFSFSKCFNMTGWRLGFLAGNAELVDGLATVKSNIDNGQLRAIQFAGIAALRAADTLLPKINAVYQRRRDRVVETLNSLGWTIEKPKATMYVFAPVPAPFNGDSIKFAMDLFDKTGVAITPGVGFGASGEGYFRISLTYPDDVIDRAMKKLASLLK